MMTAAFLCPSVAVAPLSIAFCAAFSVSVDELTALNASLTAARFCDTVVPPILRPVSLSNAASVPLSFRMFFSITLFDGSPFASRLNSFSSFAEVMSTVGVVFTLVSAVLRTSSIAAASMLPSATSF